jgi:hypothetical protein
MVFFPPGCVLRGFAVATYRKYVSPQTLVRLDEHIDVKNQDVKSRRMAGPNEKNPHL